MMQTTLVPRYSSVVNMEEGNFTILEIHTKLTKIATTIIFSPVIRKKKEIYINERNWGVSGTLRGSHSAFIVLFFSFMAYELWFSPPGVPHFFLAGFLVSLRTKRKSGYS